MKYIHNKIQLNHPVGKYIDNKIIFTFITCLPISSDIRYNRLKFAIFKYFYNVSISEGPNYILN